MESVMPLCLSTLFKILSFDTAAVMSSWYRKVIEPTPSIGPSPTPQACGRTILICSAGTLVYCLLSPGRLWDLDFN
jgi:hypothetical protein